VLVALIEPMRQRRLQFEQDLHFVKQMLQEGTEKANTIAQETWILAKEAMHQRFF
jgi:tryptophanyl-tRNA synthetase